MWYMPRGRCWQAAEVEQRVAEWRADGVGFVDTVPGVGEGRCAST